MRAVFALLAGMIMSAPTLAETTPEGVVNELFDAMRAGDGAAIRALVNEGAPLQRLAADGTLREDSFEKWSAWVDTLDAGDVDELVFGVETFYGGPGFATVSAPFVIYMKDELVGCGVNQFTMVKITDGWRIVHGIDVQHEGNCRTYRASVMSRYAQP
jgi:hypothetical protein